MTTSLAGFRKKNRQEKPRKSFESREKTIRKWGENENTVTRFYFSNLNILRKFHYSSKFMWNEFNKVHFLFTFDCLKNVFAKP